MDSMERKRRMAKRVKEMTTQLDSLKFEDLLLIRTSLLESYGLEVKKALDILNDINPKKGEF